MNPRSRSLLPILGAGLLLAASPLGWLSCSPPNGADLDAADKERPGAKAGCEEATPALLNTNQNMVPGRDCAACHRAGGQATNSPFTLAGTLFADLNAPCNPGGVSNAYIEVLDGEGDLQPNGLLRTNGVGNFYTTARYDPPIKVRAREYTNEGPKLMQVEKMKKGVMALVSVPTGTIVKEAVMVIPVGVIPGSTVRVNCADCHQFPGLTGAPGRVFLNDTHIK